MTRALVFSKNHLKVGIPKGAGGNKYDVLRGDISTLRATGGSFVSAFCIQENGGPIVNDPAIPAAGDGFYYLSRDVFKAYTGTWSSLGSAEEPSRDAKITACLP